MKRLSRFLTRHWWIGVVALVVGAACLFIAAVYAPTEVQPPPEETPDKTISGWGVPVLMVAILLIVGGVVLLVQASQRSRWRRPDTRQKMIQELTRSLQKALTAVDSIRREIDEGNELIQSLEEEKEIKSRLAKLSSDEAEAVVAQMREAARQAAGRSTVVQVTVNFLFFAAGAVVSFVIAQRF